MPSSRRARVVDPAVLIAAVAAVPAVAAAAGSSATFTNPLASGADPTMQLVNGTYYYSDTTGGDVMLGSGTTPQAAVTSAMTDIYRQPSGTSNVWAPDLEYSATTGLWDCYFSAQVNGVDHRMYVIQSTTSNPYGSWVAKGQITDPTNDWAIDGTTLTTAAGSQYFIWSGWPGSTNYIQNLYIAPMSNAYTVSGSRSLISSPTNSWETQGGPPSVNEGPIVLTHNGTTTLVYCASGSWTDNYCLGDLVLTAGADPTLASSWTKSSGPVFASANGVYGPGGAAFTTSDNGTRDWIVYHANVSSVAAGGTVWNRNVRVQPFSWNPDNSPSFGQPVPVTVPIQWGPVQWDGAINGSANDSVHSYLSAANWVGGTVTDNFANVTLTDNTTLYLTADHTTAGDWSFTYGSGQKFLSFQSDSATLRTVTLNGNVAMNTPGGANTIYLSTPARPVTLALGGTQRTFNLAAGDTFEVDGGLTGSAGLVVAGGGTLVLLNGGKTYTGITAVTNGTLSAGDGVTAGTAGGNLSPTSVVSLAPNGTLALAGVPNAAEVETIAGLTGTGSVVGTNAAGATLTLADAADQSFAGSVGGSALSVAVAGPAAQSFTGTTTYGGPTVVTAGTLHLAGTTTNTAGLRLSGGTTTVDGSVATTGFSSVGLNAGDNAALTVDGSLTVNDSLNVGDNGTGAVTLLAGGSVAVESLFVAKFGGAVGIVAQTGGRVTTLPGGGDWRIGGGNSTADAAAVGTYNLAGGSFADANNLQVGAFGRGTLTQTGGTATVGGYLSVGRFAGSVGTVNVSGGTLTATGQTVAIVGEQGTGTLEVSNTAAVAVQQLSIGHNGGVGTVAQTGGTVTATAGVLLGRVAGGSGAYTLSGGTLAAASVAGGAGTSSFTFDGGRLTPTADSTAFIQGLSTATVTANGGTLDTAGHAVTVAQPFAGPGGLTKAGLGTLTLSGSDTYAGPTTVAVGTLALTPAGSVAGGLTVDAGAALTFAAQPAGGGLLVRSDGPLTIGGAASVTPADVASDRTVLVAPSVTFAGGRLDLSDNDAIVRNGSLSALTAAAAQGFAGGTWNGTGGLTSLSAATDPAHLTALAVASPLSTTFDGQPVSPADVLVKYTYYGDANLDGLVTAADYTRVDVGFVDGLTGWANGDFNYDGVVDGTDYALMDNSFNRQSAATPSALVASPAADVAAVPEPAAATGVVLVFVAALGRRRRDLCRRDSTSGLTSRAADHARA